MQTKQFSQIVSCTTKISKYFVSTKFQQLYFYKPCHNHQFARLASLTRARRVSSPPSIPLS
nr:MAG TPA: hypothetical protein [Caudoviricetes sp.]